MLLLVTAVASTAVVAGSGAAADPPAADWAELRMCESSNRYTVNTGSGYYGAYQFDLPTWSSVGGKGYPHEAAPAEQDYRALYLYRMRGWQPWECAGMRGLQPDPDARSKRVPTYAESAYIGGGSTAPPNAMPPWPGVVYVFGDCAPALRRWQLRMNVHGYQFQGSGCYFAETERAVLALQRANGITASGKLGPKTWRAAWQGVAPKP
ncbi:Putative peptidoglycan binding domain-containing protein [Actinokineospora alba]|uniref:Putative peptidoglycan binding domain-containing protein n=2 Tax=Actinokineospora alba TaxID=504798 RepID=A0A1H0GE45_9PSEU|nr:transglycosylase family protein [Actinokineospora alba]TDP69859.1 putative peptidoglycan binding protein [Actinokineospora alba]WCJ12572.1 Rpf-E-1 [Actinokineospora alba]SDI07164.1 Putative peptidoglycan binding domain-containing protein [Actinokineospora alba]SDO05136.1 Putative peptidoglycan binding domain-containing protein [Actinokineospora alba]